MTADQPTPDDAPLLPEHLIELLATAIRKGTGPLGLQEYTAAVHVLDALSESVFPALAGDATAMIGIVMGQLREARERSAALATALTAAVDCFDPGSDNCPGVNGYADRSEVDGWRDLLTGATS